MKETMLLLLLLTSMLFIAGCAKSNNEEKSYNGEVTDLSKKYLSKGYAINIYRSSTRLGDDLDSYGKAYINMTFGVLTEYTSIASYDANAEYNIKKVVVTNARIISKSKMGFDEDLIILKTYSQSIDDPHVDVVSSKTKYEIVNNPANNTGVQSQVMVHLNKIALYDESISPSAANGNQPTLKQIYDELGITRDEVAIKIGFRIELITVSNKTLYKDYEIIVPPVGIDITDSEYHYEFYKTETNQMEPFLEKN